MICCFFIALAAGATGLFFRFIKSSEDSLAPKSLSRGEGETCACAVNQTSNRRKKVTYGAIFVLCTLGLVVALALGKCLLGHHS